MGQPCPEKKKFAGTWKTRVEGNTTLFHCSPMGIHGHAIHVINLFTCLPISKLLIRNSI